jgi:hypothetical protein
MSTIKSQALLFNIDHEANAAGVGGAVIMDDGVLLVGGTVGTIPGSVATAIIDTAKKQGVTLEVLNEDPTKNVCALVWGEIDWSQYWPAILHGLALSMTQATLGQLAGLEVSDVITGSDDDDEIPF